MFSIIQAKFSGKEPNFRISESRQHNTCQVNSEILRKLPILTLENKIFPMHFANYLLISQHFPEYFL